MKPSIISALSLLAPLSLISTQALADVTLRLADVEANQCEKFQREIYFLSTPTVAFNVTCSAYNPKAYYSAIDGKYYDYQIYTTVTIQGDVQVGQEIALGYINSNSPAYAMAAVSRLSSQAITVTPTLSEYSESGYKSDNGRAYNYRVYTGMVINQL